MRIDRITSRFAVFRFFLPRFAGFCLFAFYFSLAPQGVAQTGGSPHPPQPPGVSFKVLHTFGKTAGDGALPAGSFCMAGNSFYIMTLAGGAGNSGAICRIDIASGKCSVLHSFTRSEGHNFGMSLTLAGPDLYGTAEFGGEKDAGTIFKYNIPAGEFTLLHSFTGKDGASPVGSLVLSGPDLYGMTAHGGQGSGVIFKYDIAGGKLTVLHSFTEKDGVYPQGSLALAGTDLYGTTSFGGAGDCGVIFKYSIPEGKVTLLHSFTGKDGFNPCGFLTISCTALYGMAFRGGAEFRGGIRHHDGAQGCGVIFKCDALTGKVKVLHSFDPVVEGAWPDGGLTLSGTRLYGMTSEGGPGGYGTVFSFDTKKGVLSLLHSLTNGADGGSAAGSLELIGKTLYGLAGGGGDAGGGVLFSISGKSIK